MDQSAFTMDYSTTGAPPASISSVPQPVSIPPTGALVDAATGYAPSAASHVSPGANQQMRPHPHPQQIHPHQLQQQQQHQFQQQQQQQQQLDPMTAAYAPHPYARERTPTPPSTAMHHHSGGVSGGVEQKAVHLLSACESCLLVVRIPGYDMSFRRIMERKCPRCAGMLMLPQENMEMFILYGHFIPETVGATIVLGTMALHPSFRADFVAAVMNELLVPLQTDFVYDIAVPKRREGLGMSLRMHSKQCFLSFFPYLLSSCCRSLSRSDDTWCCMCE